MKVTVVNLCKMAGTCIEMIKSVSEDSDPDEKVVHPIV